MATLDNIAKNSSTVTNVDQSAPAVNAYTLMIDDTYFLLIDGTYQLSIQDEASGTTITNITKN